MIALHLTAPPTLPVVCDVSLTLMRVAVRRARFQLNPMPIENQLSATV